MKKREKIMLFISIIVIIIIILLMIKGCESTKSKNVDITYKILENSNTSVIQLILDSNVEIEEIELPDGTKKSIGKSGNISLEYEVYENGVYTFKVISKDGEEIIKKIVYTKDNDNSLKEKDENPFEEENLTNQEQNNETIKTNNKNSFVSVNLATKPITTIKPNASVGSNLEKEEVPKEIELIVSLEEIENNQYIFPIGKTKEEYVIAVFNEDYTEVTIKNNVKDDGDGKIKDWEKAKIDENPIYLHASTLNSIKIESGITDIGSYMFYKCNKLIGSLELPNTIKNIGEYAFSNSSISGELILPVGLENLYRQCFYKCTNLTGIKLPSSLKLIDYGAFGNCTGLKGSLIIPDNVTTIGRAAFYACKGLTSLTLGENLITIDEQAFRDCSGLKTIEFGKNLKTIAAQAFYKCTSLKQKLILPETVEVIGQSAFNGCVNLIDELYIPKSVKSIGKWAFDNCKNITALKLNEGLEFIGYCAFNGCLKIAGTLEIPSTVKVIDDFAFNHCENITTLKLNEGLEEIGLSAFQLCINLTGDLILPSTLEIIEDNAFIKNSKLNGILEIPGKVKRIGAQAFVETNITTLKLNEGVEEIGDSAFKDVKTITGEIEFPSTLKVIEDYAFNGCKGINSIKLNEGLIKIGGAAFQLCTGLNDTLILPSTVEYIGTFAFNHCSSLKNISLELPKNLKGIGGYIKDGIETATESSHTFYDFATNYIKEYTISNDNKYFKTIDGVLYTKDGTRMIAYPAKKETSTFEIPEGLTLIDELCMGKNSNTYTLQLPDSYILTTKLPSSFLNTGNNLALALYNYSSIKEIKVKDTNKNYKTEAGVLYSKDGTILWYVPKNKSGEIEILDTVTTVKNGALYGRDENNIKTNIKFNSTITDCGGYNCSWFNE